VEVLHLPFQALQAFGRQLGRFYAGLLSHWHIRQALPLEVAKTSVEGILRRFVVIAHQLSKGNQQREEKVPHDGFSLRLFGP
jgi:hypothetical protein